MAVPWHEPALWGLLGGAILDGLDLAESIRRNHGRIPARYRRVGLWVGEAIRLVAGAGLAVALDRGGYASGVMGYFMAGVAAPAIMSRLSREVPHMSQERTDGHGQ